MGFGTERVDYWPDYYAFLDVEPEADADAIKKSVRDFRAEVHPDANRRANEDRKLINERLRKHIDEAEEVLLGDGTLRAEFNMFREEYPERIATIGRGDGIITIPAGAATPLNPEPMDLDALMRGDLPEPDNALAGRVLQMIGHNAGSSSIDAMRAAYKAVPDNADIKEGYKAALRDELLLAGVQLGGAWQSAGAKSIAEEYAQSLGDPYRPLLSVEEQIEEVADEVIPETVQTRVTALLEGNTDKPLLLPAPNAAGSTELTNPDEAQVTEITELAKERFKERAKFIEKAAARRAQLMTDLLGLADTHAIKDDVEDRTRVYMHLTHDSGDGARVVATFDVKLSEEGNVIENNGIEEFSGKTIEELHADGTEVNSYTMEFMPEIGEDLGSHLYHILHKYGYLEAEKAVAAEEEPDKFADLIEPKSISPDSDHIQERGSWAIGVV